MEECSICPMGCSVDRFAGEKGVCKTGAIAPVVSYGPHFGEEPPLVGQHGSGTIFFGSCNLLCTFCQNYDISRLTDSDATYVTPDELADIMIYLQKLGCHNINFVTPTHVVPQILQALPVAVEKGLHLPLVYNSSGYDSPDTLELLEGVIDIYMPDFKFWDNATGEKYTSAKNYGDVARHAIKIMHDQVGDLVLDKNGIGMRGLLVRHLVMPGLIDESKKILTYLSEMSPRCSVNIMDQYRPCGEASHPIDRPLSGNEFQEVLDFASTTQLIQLNENKLFDLLRKLSHLR